MNLKELNPRQRRSLLVAGVLAVLCLLYPEIEISYYFWANNQWISFHREYERRLPVDTLQRPVEKPPFVDSGLRKALSLSFGQWVNTNEGDKTLSELSYERRRSIQPLNVLVQIGGIVLVSLLALWAFSTAGEAATHTTQTVE